MEEEADAVLGGVGGRPLHVDGVRGEEEGGWVGGWVGGWEEVVPGGELVEVEVDALGEEEEEEEVGGGGWVGGEGGGEEAVQAAGGGGEGEGG